MIKPTLAKPRYAVALAAGIDPPEVGDRLFAVMDGCNADLYYENDGTPRFAGRIMCAIDTCSFKTLCDGSQKPEFVVVYASRFSAAFDIEAI